MTIRLPLYVALVTALIIACGDDSSSGGSSTGAGGTGGGTGGEGGLSCEDQGGTCLAAPAGFKGPVELSDSGATSCTNEAFEGTYVGEEFEAVPAECNCACAPETACALEVTAFGDTGCLSGPEAVSVTSGVCQAAPPDTLALTVEATLGTCQSDGATASVPSIKFTPYVVGCSVNLNDCDASTICVPSTRKYCFWSETESTCPSGFDEQLNVLRREDFSDDRDCTCDCGLGDVACAPSVELFSDATCTTAEAATDTAGCNATNSGQAAASLRVNANATGQCELTTQVVGTVVQSGAGILVCCAP
jgi:hypothetical protein